MKKRVRVGKNRQQLAFELDEIIRALEDSFIIKLQTFFDKLTSRILKKADNLTIFKKSLEKTDDKDVIALKDLFRGYYKKVGKDSVAKLNDEIKNLSGASSKIKIPDINEGLRYRAEILALKKTADFRDTIIQKITEGEGSIKDKKDLIKTVKNASKVFANRNIKTVARMESVTAVNTSRYEAGMKSKIVKGWQFLAILDKRTTVICRARHGMILKKDDPRVRGSFRAPCHWNCRSILSPVTIFEDLPFTPDNKLDSVPPKFFGTETEETKLLDQTNIEKSQKIVYEQDTHKLTEKDLNSIVKKRELEIVKESKNKYEIASVFDTNGNMILNRTQKNESSVYFNPSDRKILKNAEIMTHNHPNGSSFSLDDIVFSLAHGVNEMRAVSHEFNYYGKGTFVIKNLSKTKIDDKKVVKLFNKHKKNLIIENSKLIMSGELDKKVFSSKVSHELWTKISDELNLDYKFEEL